MCNKATKKLSKWLKNYINGTKGAIALFLAILMVPFASIAAALINAGRINSAVAIFDEALCNASNSTLGTYDSFLRSRFALMAMDQNTSFGGTQYGRTSSAYTADDLINDVFSYYMEKNVGSLSNTYKSTDLNAAGLYPLSDNSVLLSSLLQSSKITVPAKLAVDWGSLDDMISNLTKPLKLVGSVESLLTSGSDVASDIDELSEKQDDFEEKIDDCNTARDEYNTAYTEFSTAAGEFNTLIDNITSAQQSVSSKQTAFDNLRGQVAALEQQIQDKKAKIKELEEDEDEDHEEEIAQLEEEIEKIEDEIEKKSPGYSKAKQELESAKTTLENYKIQFSTKREAVVNKKTAYYDKIVNLRDKIDKTCKAAIKFQDACKTLTNDAEGLITSTVSLGVDIAKNNNKKRQDELQQEADTCVVMANLAEKDGYPEYIDYYYEIKQENDSTIRNLKDDSVKLENKGAIAKAALDSLKSANSGLVEFADRNLEGEYKVIFDSLEALRLKVINRSVPSGYSKITYSDLYYTVNNPIEKSEPSVIVDNVENEIKNSGGWAMLKTLISFVKALFDIKLAYDPELAVTIDTSKYAPNGGLPSKIDRSIHSLASPFQDEDEALSNYYKTVLNTYSSEDIYSTEVLTASSFERMMGYIETLLDLISNFKLRKLPKIFETAGNIIKELCSTSLSDLAVGLAKTISSKAMLVGYISYNTANRTTFGGKALTGKSFGLPMTETANGYVFSGAETEYIYHGSLNEKDNQESVFRGMWIMRMLIDLPIILGDATVQSLASGVASATFGLGAIIVYAIFIAAEGIVDCIILVNNGTIPMVKAYVYLTPQGIPRLLKALTSLSISEGLQKDLYEKSMNCATKMEDQLGHSVVYPRYDDYISESSKLDKKFSNVFTWDYTKSLQFMLLLTRRSSTMLSRLADVIEMEAAYNASKGAATYLYNLDKSFTYLRASGSFNSSVFIKIGEDSELNSNKRVIYNGY